MCVYLACKPTIVSTWRKVEYCVQVSSIRTHHLHACEETDEQCERQRIYEAGTVLPVPGNATEGVAFVAHHQLLPPHHNQSNVANFCCPKTFSPPVPISITNDAFPSRPIFQDFCKSYFSTWQHDSCLNRSNLIPQIVLTQLLILLADRNSKTKPSFIIPRYVIHLSYLCLPEAYILHRLKPTIVQLCFCKFQKFSSSENA